MPSLAYGSFGNTPGVWILWEHAKRFLAGFFCPVLSETVVVSMELYIYIPRTGMLIHSENAWGFGSAGGNQAQHWHVDPFGKCLVPKPWVLAH